MKQPVLNLGLLSADSKNAITKRGDEIKFDRIMAVQEEPVQITFFMPDDSIISKEVHNLSFKKGHTVAVLKACLEDEYNIKQEETQLYLDGALLLDPLSLTDFPCISRVSAVDIQVRRTCSDAKKSEVK